MLMRLVFFPSRSVISLSILLALSFSINIWNTNLSYGILNQDVVVINYQGGAEKQPQIST